MTQDVFLKAFASPPAATEDVRLRPWLFRVATNACLNLIRSRRSDGLAEPDLVAARNDPFEQARTAALIEGALGAVNERYRAALVLKDLHGVGGEELADVLEIYARRRTCSCTGHEPPSAGPSPAWPERTRWPRPTSPSRCPCWRLRRRSRRCRCRPALSAAHPASCRRPRRVRAAPRRPAPVPPWACSARSRRPWARRPPHRRRRGDRRRRRRRGRRALRPTTAPAPANTPAAAALTAAGSGGRTAHRGGSLHDLPSHHALGEGHARVPTARATATTAADTPAGHDATAEDHAGRREPHDLGLPRLDQRPLGTSGSSTTDTASTTAGTHDGGDTGHDGGE